MRERYLEVTFREGRALAAYLYLSGSSDPKSVRTEKVGDGLVVDYSATGEAIGIEITAPTEVSPDDLNEVLESLGKPPLTTDELAPLAAA